MAGKLKTDWVTTGRIKAFADHLKHVADTLTIQAEEIENLSEEGLYMFGGYSMRESEIRLRTIESELVDAVRELRAGQPYDAHATKSRLPADALRAELQRRREAYEAGDHRFQTAAESRAKYTLSGKNPKKSPPPRNKGKGKKQN